LTFVLSTED